MTQKYSSRIPVLVAVVALLFCADRITAGEKLKIVFMLGQDEMVGRAELPALAYMLQKPAMPPRDTTVNAHKGMPHQINGAYLYWQAMNSYGGPEKKKQELKALIEERTRFKAAFKEKVIAELEKNDGMFRGRKYSKRRGRYRGFWLFNMCDEEAEKEGLTPKIRALLEAPDNKFDVEAAYDQLSADADARYRRQVELNARYLKGTTVENFAAYSEALKEYEAGHKDAQPSERRPAIAALAEKHLHLPVAERTYITYVGAIEPHPEDDSVLTAEGRLSVGYGANARSIGLEYAAGMALEKELSGPVLIVKCAWEDRTSIADFWRIPERKEAAEPTATVPEPGRAWKVTQAHIRNILADPGKHHPGYDAKAGFEPAGLIWYAGSYDQNNPGYSAQLASLLTDIRKLVGRPKLPTVCLTVGAMFFKGESDDHPVNRSLRTVSAMEGFKGTVDVMDAYLWRAAELAAIRSMIHKRKITPDAAMQEALRYGGRATFNILAGHEAGMRLAGLVE